MGNTYCLSSDSKCMQNDQTINVQICEEDIEEKKIPQIKNLESNNNVINTTDGYSNNNNTITNHLNNQTNHSNLIVINNLPKSKNPKKNNGKRNSKRKSQTFEIDDKNSDKNNEPPLQKFSLKQIVALNNDVIVSGNEVSPEKIYIKTKLLGSGAFGEVWLVHHKDLERDFAMKIIKKRKNKASDDKEIINEISILKKLDHPKILKVIDFYSTLKKYYIITEYCPEGELFNEIIKVGKFDEGQAAFIINQILKAVSYCHKMNIIHRDIKPENIMITNREKNGCLQVKLIDFGTAKIFERGQQENKYVGSSYYMAPEILKRQYNEKCDLWSIGVILYILLTGRPPFDGNDDEEILENVKKGVYDKWGTLFQFFLSNQKI